MIRERGLGIVTALQREAKHSTFDEAGIEQGVESVTVTEGFIINGKWLTKLGGGDGLLRAGEFVDDTLFKRVRGDG